MSRDEDAVVAAVGERENFFPDVLIADLFDDWNLAWKFGEFLIGIDPNGMMGHFILARACRHRGDFDRAAQELGECLSLIAKGTVSPVEVEVLAPQIEKERRLLASSAGMAIRRVTKAGR